MSVDWYVRDADGAVRGPMTIEVYSEWARTQQNMGVDANRVAADDLSGDVRVSTVFLNFDHSHWAGGPPILFETMIFGGPWDQYQWRYATEAEARKAHDLIVAALKSGNDPNEAVPS